MVNRKALAQRIRLELNQLEQTVATVHRHWQRAETDTGDSDAFLNSVALNLHSFYNGLERIMELIAVEMDGGTLGGEAWHVELLRQMSMELGNVRPAVLSQESYLSLDEYRKFRHRVRNIYATHLESIKMRHLIENLSPTWHQIQAELVAFSNFLDNLEDSI